MNSFPLFPLSVRLSFPLPCYIGLASIVDLYQHNKFRTVCWCNRISHSKLSMKLLIISLNYGEMKC